MSTMEHPQQLTDLPIAPDSSQVSAHHDEEIGSRPPAPKPRAAAIALTGIGLILLFAALFLFGWLPRARQSAALANEAEQTKSALPRVRVEQPRQLPAVTVAVLPGDVQALEEVTLYPRTSGYIKRWLVDIGDEVQAGKLLAEISIPEIDAQVEQKKAILVESEATLQRAEATAKLAQIGLNRQRRLAAKNAAAQQDLDDAEGALAVAEANVRLAQATIKANQADVQHTKELQSFAKVLAPFSGTITARYINTGQLVTVGNGTTQGLLTLAKTNPVRVFVDVPQMYALSVNVGLQAEIIVREMPGRKFQGSVTRTAGAIDPATRTLLTEIQVPNDDGALLTGSYVQVSMQVTRQNPPLLVRSSALLVGEQGTQLAVVDDEQRVHLRPVQVEGDFGADVGIASGINLGDRVVVNPGDRLSDNLLVAVDQPEEPKPSAVTKNP